MQDNTQQPMSDPIPSTSKEPEKNVINHTSNILPHITTMPSNSQGIRYIQVSPIKTCIKQNSNVVQLPPNFMSGLNVARLPHLNLPSTSQATNIRFIRPLNSPPGIKKTTTGSFIKILPKPPDKSTMIPLTPTAMWALTQQSAPKQGTPKKISTKNIPLILQKKALLNSKNTSNVQNMSTTFPTPQYLQNSNNLLNNSSSVVELNSNKLGNQRKSSFESTQRKTSNKEVDKDREALKLVKKKEKEQKKRTKDGSKDAKESKLSEESLYVADGFREDVEALIEKCLQVYKQLNFEKFTDVWKKMDFPSIFLERQSSAELAELSEEVIHIAKERMLARNVNYEENVAGLFLVYGLINLQPFSGFASLRLVPSDVPAVLALEAEARRQKRHDVLYVLGSVLVKGPCQFHVLNREVSLDLPIRKYYDGTVQTPNVMDSLFTKNSECVTYLKNTMSLEQRYQALRQTMQKLHQKEGLSAVNNYSKQPASQLHDLYLAHLPQARNNKLSPEELVNDILSTSKPEEDRLDLLKSIKDRAMASTVNPMKHLTGFEERLPDSSSSSEESEIEEDKPKVQSKKNRLRRKGRSSARALQDMLGIGETPEVVFVPELSQKEMPLLDDLNNDTPDGKTQENSKKIPRKTKTKEDDSNNNSKSIKINKKNKTDSTKANQKSKNDKNNLSDLASEIGKGEVITDKISADKNTNETNTEIEDIKEKTVTNNIDNSTVAKDDEIKSKDKAKTAKKQKKVTSPKKAKATKTTTNADVSKKDNTTKRNKKENNANTNVSKSPKRNKKEKIETKPNRIEASSNTPAIEDTKKELSLEQSKNKSTENESDSNQSNNENTKKRLSSEQSTNDQSLEIFKSPEEIKTTIDQLKPPDSEQVSSPETLNTRESQRIKDQTPNKEPEEKTPRKRALTPVDYKESRTFSKRVKSSFKKLGILEIYNDGTSKK